MALRQPSGRSQMDKVQMQADLDKLHAYISVLMDDVEATRRWQRWTTPMLISSIVFFASTCFVVWGIAIAKFLNY